MPLSGLWSKASILNFYQLLQIHCCHNVNLMPYTTQHTNLSLVCWSEVITWLFVLWWCETHAWIEVQRGLLEHGSFMWFDFDWYIFISMTGQQYVFEDLTVANLGETTAARICSARIAPETLAAMALVLRLAVNASSCWARPHNSARREWALNTHCAHSLTVVHEQTRLFVRRRHS